MWELLSWGQSWDENFSFLLYYQVEIWANKPLEPLDAESSFHLIPSPYSSLTENEGQVSSDVTSKIGNGKKQMRRTACHPATCHLATLPSCTTKRLDVSSCDFNSKVSDISASCHGTPQRLQVNHVWWPDDHLWLSSQPIHSEAKSWDFPIQTANQIRNLHIHDNWSTGTRSANACEWQSTTRTTF